MYVNSTSVVHWICVHIFPFLSPLYAGVNKQKKKIIIIMRGLPGSGKSTLARFVTHRAQAYIRTYMARLVHCAYVFVCVCVCVCGTHCSDLRGRTGVICSTDDFFFQNGQ